MRNLEASIAMLASLNSEGTQAMDVLYVALIIGFFAVTVGLVRFCAALLSNGGRP